MIIYTFLCFGVGRRSERSRGRRRDEEAEQQMASMAAGPDHLFNLRNSFYLGAYQAAINNSEIPNLSQEDIVERDCLVHRSYIALGSYQVRLCDALVF